MTFIWLLTFSFCFHSDSDYRLDMSARYQQGRAVPVQRDQCEAYLMCLKHFMVLQSIFPHTVSYVILTTTLWGRCHDAHFTEEGMQGLRHTWLHDLEFTRNLRLKLETMCKPWRKWEVWKCDLLINRETYTNNTLPYIFPVLLFCFVFGLFVPFPLSHFIPFFTYTKYLQVYWNISSPLDL